jgi:hypothetical protein
VSDAGTGLEELVLRETANGLEGPANSMSRNLGNSRFSRGLVREEVRNEGVRK